MSAYFSIVRLTCRGAMRSHVFQFLLAVLLLGVLIVPNSIKGDGSAYGYIQVSLEYSLSFISTMLMLSGIWLGCQTMTQDLEDSRIHLVAVKPVSRTVIWFGKFSGVMLLLTVLLLISAVAVFGFVTWQYKRAGLISDTKNEEANFNARREQTRIANEVLTGRRVYMPKLPDIEKMVADEFSKKMSETTPDGKKVLNIFTEDQRTKIMDEIRRQVKAGLSEVKPGQTRVWEYEGLPKDFKDRLFVRYRVYTGGTSQTAEMVSGAWGAVVFFMKEPDPADVKAGAKAEPVITPEYIVRPPEQILCISVNELELPGDKIVYDGKTFVGYTNLSPKGPVQFQLADGPKVLIREVSFLNNYLRAVLMEWLGIFAITMIAFSAASFLSMPTAIFFTLCYIAYGAFSLFLLGPMKNYGSIAAMPAVDAYGYVVGRIFLTAVIPVQKFAVSELVANGELIEFSLIGAALLFQVILKGAPLALLGIWIYNRRELAMASTKR